MGIASIIAGLISGLMGPIVQWAAMKQKQAAARVAAQDALDLEQMKLDAESVHEEGENSMVRLKSTGETFKYLTFCMWFYPFIIGQFRPTMAKAVFDNLNLMPSWYTNSCVIIMFAIWGISVGAPVVASVFSSLGSYLQNGRDVQYNHEQEIAKINRDAVIASIQHDLGGQIDPKTTEMINRGLDAGERQNVATALHNFNVALVD